MILKKIKIMNYRQLQSVELDMQESLTVLAGPNNSGKTTLISVLKGMFCDKKLGFSYSDIPISLSSMWLEKTVPVFQEIMLEYDKEKGVQKIIDEMTDNDKLSKDYTTNDEHIKQSNQYYTEKYGKLTEKAVRENLLEISYGETPFTSLYTGKLSHDDLLMFASKLIKRYPVLLKKIGDKYNYIFIDEYQDTSSYVLDIFYDAVKNRENVQIYLFGDRMQQIYRNYDGSFEGKLKEFDTSDRLEVNFRSIGKIVSILNNIYNDSSFEQQPTESNVK